MVMRLGVRSDVELEYDGMSPIELGGTHEAQVELTPVLVSGPQ